MSGSKEIIFSFEEIRARKYYLYHHNHFVAMKQKIKEIKQIKYCPTFEKEPSIKSCISQWLRSNPNFQKLCMLQLDKAHKDNNLEATFAEESSSAMSFTTLSNESYVLYYDPEPENVVTNNNMEIIDSISENSKMIVAHHNDEEGKMSDLIKQDKYLQSLVNPKTSWSCFGGMDTAELNNLFSHTEQNVLSKIKASTHSQVVTQNLCPEQAVIEQNNPTSTNSASPIVIIEAPNENIDGQEDIAEEVIESVEKLQIVTRAPSNKRISCNDTFVLMDYNKFSSEVHQSSKQTPVLQLSSTMRQSMFEQKIGNFQATNAANKPYNVQDHILDDNIFAKPYPVPPLNRNEVKPSENVLQPKVAIVCPSIAEVDDDNDFQDTVMEERQESDTVPAYQLLEMSNRDLTYQIYQDSKHSQFIGDDSVFAQANTNPANHQSAYHLNQQQYKGSEQRHHSFPRSHGMTYAQAGIQHESCANASYRNVNRQKEDLNRYVTPVAMATGDKPTPPSAEPTVIKPKGLIERKPLQCLNQFGDFRKSPSAMAKEAFDFTSIPSYLLVAKAPDVPDGGNNATVDTSNIVQCHNDTELLGMGMSCYKFADTTNLLLDLNDSVRDLEPETEPVNCLATTREEQLIYFDDDPLPDVSLSGALQISKTPIEPILQGLTDTIPKRQPLQTIQPHPNAATTVHRRQPLQTINPLNAPNNYQRGLEISEMSFNPQLNSTTIPGRCIAGQNPYPRTDNLLNPSQRPQIRNGSVANTLTNDEDTFLVGQKILPNLTLINPPNVNLNFK